jgi:effector-binding domain-containing protein
MSGMAHYGAARCSGDDSQVDYEVKLAQVESRRTAVVAAATTWQEFPALWGQLLGEVWQCLRAGGIHRGCRNIMLYLDSVPNVEIGVLLDQPCPLTGRVVTSALPSGTAAMTVHRGPFGNVGAAHDAVLSWCAAHGHRPNGDPPGDLWTERRRLSSAVGGGLLAALLTGQSRPDEPPRITGRYAEPVENP